MTRRALSFASICIGVYLLVVGGCGSSDLTKWVTWSTPQLQ